MADALHIGHEPQSSLAVAPAHNRDQFQVKVRITVEVELHPRAAESKRYFDVTEVFVNRQIGRRRGVAVERYMAAPQDRLQRAALVARQSVPQRHIQQRGQDVRRGPGIRI